MVAKGKTTQEHDEKMAKALDRKKATRWSPFLVADSPELQGKSVLKGDGPSKRGCGPLI